MAFWHYDEHDVIGRIAGADLSQSQHRAVERNAGNEIVRANAGDSYGLLTNNPRQREEASVLIGEGAIAPAVSGAAFTLDAKLVSDANGRLVAVAPGAGVPAAYQYRAEEAATAADQIVAVRRESGVLVG